MAMRTNDVNLRTAISIVLAVILSLCTVFSNTLPVNASDGWVVGLDSSMWSDYSYPVWVTNEDYEYAKIDSVESSNTSVITIRHEEWTDENGEIQEDYIVESKKAGKSIVAVNYTRPDGISETYEKTVTVKKHPKEIKSLKINGKKINTNANKFGVYLKCKKTKVSVKAALKKGWKISGISAYIYKDNYEKYKKLKVTSKMIKKGTKIKFPKEYELMTITLNLNKGKTYIFYTIDLHR